MLYFVENILLVLRMCYLLVVLDILCILYVVYILMKKIDLSLFNVIINLFYI